MKEALSPFELNRKFKIDRPVMAEYNQENGNMLEMVAMELLEFQDAWNHYVKDPTEAKLNHVCKEACDVILCLDDIMRQEGRGTEEELRNAIGMNIAQYPAHFFQKGQVNNNGIEINYHEARYRAKRESKELHLKEDFYGGETIDGKQNGVIFDKPNHMEEPDVQEKTHSPSQSQNGQDPRTTEHANRSTLD